MLFPLDDGKKTGVGCTRDLPLGEAFRFRLVFAHKLILVPFPGSPRI